MSDGTHLLIGEETLEELLLARKAAYQADTTATEVAQLAADFNSLLGKLKAAGLMGTE